MKLAVVILALATLAGCATVEDIEHSPATLSVISGKKPNEYADCVIGKLGSDREPPMMTARNDGVRLIVAQKLTDSPAAVIDIDERSSGSSIKVHERMNNLPIRGDVKRAAEACISG
ncbi:hypothetical protein RRX38_03825 [Pseudomonas sp. DTU_2021_1001937_2_SI_NGA_ILE_001]|uniref:hypothetical protein n=1 Tax=Pseudomonas sp. DTU_2021_1001937_2_SI_NGA_ILE_001 TaxID=3077589 RepID=UPI0025E6BEDE|nr:hypothetical protein [Pseudomonas sp. DTU_2021_1001937_2_SI_NGA_ILE_001]WNW10315.1 hypothetical protein RRX38_03825 [Pseudomonas sp. DTU_2021_1001937_2_SI_NGA_ILE_001]